MQERRLVKKQRTKFNLFRQYVDADDRLLHIGCVGGIRHDDWSGKAWLHGDLERLCDDVVGIDIDDDAVAMLQEEGHDIRVKDAQAFDFEQSFDTIVAANVIEHLSNPGAMLECAAENLAEGGTVIVTTPRIWSLHHILTYLKDREVIVDPTHTCWFDDPTFRRLVDLSPLRVREHRTFSWDRIPASELDRLYLNVENLFRDFGVGKWLLDYQHYYVLEVAE